MLAGIRNEQLTFRIAAVALHRAGRELVEVASTAGNHQVCHPAKACPFTSQMYGAWMLEAFAHLQVGSPRQCSHAITSSLFTEISHVSHMHHTSGPRAVGKCENHLLIVVNQ